MGLPSMTRQIARWRGVAVVSPKPSSLLHRSPSRLICLTAVTRSTRQDPLGAFVAFGATGSTAASGSTVMHLTLATGTNVDQESRA